MMQTNAPGILALDELPHPWGQVELQQVKGLLAPKLVVEWDKYS
jgi:hypothetical protein